eukprot:4924275-Pyramimonas_sp.AAC.1
MAAATSWNKRVAIVHGRRADRPRADEAKCAEGARSPVQWPARRPGRRQAGDFAGVGAGGRAHGCAPAAAAGGELKIQHYGRQVRAGPLARPRRVSQAGLPSALLLGR